jgi:predicted O-linked N-acetylglucosamine transferase (SPINDLY family)
VWACGDRACVTLCDEIATPTATKNHTVTHDPNQAIDELAELLAQSNPAMARQRAHALLALHPKVAELWRLSAIAALQLGDYHAADAMLQNALELAPNLIEAWCNRASLQAMRGDTDAAETTLQHALMLAPGHAAALNNHGRLRHARGDHAGAAQDFSAALRSQPDYANGWLNLAAAQQALQDFSAAENSARRALALAPDWPDAWFVLGTALAKQQRGSEAVAAYRTTLKHAPRHAQAAYNLALELEEKGDWLTAARACERALDAAPDACAALAELVFLKRRLCEWDGLDALSARLLEAVDRGEEGVTPFSFLAEAATPAQQLKCARRFAQTQQAIASPLAARLRFAAVHQTTPTSEKLRIGFFSAGFGEHPTALLIFELIERLRDSSLHTIAFATTSDDGGNSRQRLMAGFHECRDLSGFTLEQTARAVAAARPDILIDLDGYCSGSMPALFTLKIAPLQVNWLAYPGTLGATYYDYLIADHFVVPPTQGAFYSEAIARLPRCFQPNDSTRVIAAPLARRDYDLPESGIVFASFNNSYKFTLRTFSRWMKILAGVPDSVLWLLASPHGTSTDANLRRAAQASGIDPQRLVFAPKIAHAQHLARYLHADLFLDSNPYNAHTTASDALWAGCPLLTQPGATFAARVAGSLNHHLSMHELNTDSDQAYVDLAITLGRDPARLRELRERLAEANNASGLFDMRGYAQDFERLLIAMFARHQRGETATDLELP